MTEDTDAPTVSNLTPSLSRGVDAIRAALEQLPLSPGVYRMLNPKGEVLYVGKARQLKRRVANYTQPVGLSNRIRRMISETTALEVITTHTEVEALLLEINLIKKLAPRYNVLLRDDKSFPHILVTTDHPYPQITKHRGPRERKGRYYGPFASAGSVARTLVALQRVFMLRICSDAMFSSRKRPCLQYQIKRCSAPCVGYIAEADYAETVDAASRFLAGRSREVQEQLAGEMQAASDALDFERAARLRDRIRALTQIQAHQDINIEDSTDADVVALHQAGGQTCIQVFFFRGGSNYGNRAYFPSHDRTMESGEVLAAFLGQFYEDKPPPPLVLLSEPSAEADLIAEALSLRAGRKVSLLVPQRGPKRGVVDHALTNARDALGRKMAESSAQGALLDGVAALFGLKARPNRIEVYDNSHISGTNALGGMIVAGPEGLMKAAYRKFNIKNPDTAPGDDFAMMREVLRRRFARALAEDPERTSGNWPDLVLIDGGAGQFSAVREIMAELGVADVPMVAISKGPDRNAGREKFHMLGREPFDLPVGDPVLYFLQRLRDEAHRFAIGSHRQKREKGMNRSELDEVVGVGRARRKALLHHFGSVRAIARAGLADLEAVTGVNRAVAKKIYDHFHPEG
ncbi:MAG: excinuclease ABC subunit UvrC [Elsteraceae bacterium]